VPFRPTPLKQHLCVLTKSKYVISATDRTQRERRGSIQEKAECFHHLNTRAYLEDGPKVATIMLGYNRRGISVHA
jgi:hypothetical protein